MRYTSKDIKNLKLFLKDYPMSKAYLLYGGDQRFYEDGIQIIPFQETISQIHEILEF